VDVRRIRRFSPSLVVLSGCALAACASFLPTSPAVREGPCTLSVVDMRTGTDDPSELQMLAAGGWSTAEVLYDGRGWEGQVAILTTDPTGWERRVAVDAQSLNAGLTGSVFDRPGTWTVEHRTPECRSRFTLVVHRGMEPAAR
jgi:hypothetical protein